MKIEIKPGVTDYFAINSPRVAKIMRNQSGKWLETGEFRSGTAKLGRIWGLLWFMLRSMVWRMPLKRTQGDTVRLRQPGKVMLQAEGEGRIFDQVETFEVEPAERKLKVVKL